MSMLVTIWMLYIVEFANLDSQEMIGYGGGNSSSKENTGSTDTMPYHTGTMQTSKSTYGVGIQYRYIENLWANVETWTDGITFDTISTYTWNNFSSYSDNYSYNSNDRISVGVRPNTSYWIQYFKCATKAGYEWFPIPSYVSSTQTSVCDYYTYDGNFEATYHFGDTLTIEETPVVSYEKLDKNPMDVCFYLKDIYRNEYWTETLTFYYE